MDKDTTCHLALLTYFVIVFLVESNAEKCSGCTTVSTDTKPDDHNTRALIIVLVCSVAGGLLLAGILTIIIWKITRKYKNKDNASAVYANVDDFRTFSASPAIVSPGKIEEKRRSKIVLPHVQGTDSHSFIWEATEGVSPVRVDYDDKWPVLREGESDSYITYAKHTDRTSKGEPILQDFIETGEAGYVRAVRPSDKRKERDRPKTAYVKTGRDGYLEPKDWSEREEKLPTFYLNVDEGISAYRQPNDDDHSWLGRQSLYDDGPGTPWSAGHV